MRPIYPAFLFLGLAACVSLQALHGSDSEVLDAQADILGGADELDALCQKRGKTETELIECRHGRDRVSAAVRRQLSSISRRGGSK